MSKTAKLHKRHLNAFRKFLVTHGVTPSEGDVPVFVTFLGSLVVYIVSALLHALKSLIKHAFAKKLPKGEHFATVTAGDKVKRLVTNIYFRLFVIIDNRKLRKRRFRKNLRDFGLPKAVIFSIADFFVRLRQNGYKIKTAVSFLAPAAAAAVLIFTVNSVAGSDFGVTVISGGEKLGVVSAENVYEYAARELSIGKSYYDVENSTGEVFVTARLEITPADGTDVIDAGTLAKALREKASVVMPEPDIETPESGADGLITVDSAVNAFAAPLPEDLAGKVKAFTVSVGGEFLGAVDEPEKLALYLNGLKSSIYEPEAIELSFSKEIEYEYEQFYTPDQIVDEQSIIKKLSGTEKAAVYVTVQNGDSPWSVAEANNISLDDLMNCPAVYNGEPIEDISEFFPTGAVIQLSEDVPYLSVLVTKPLTYQTETDFDIKRTYDDSMYKGQTRVVTKGCEGVEQIKANVTYSGDRVIKREVLSRTTLKEPVTQIEVLGTKEPKTMVATGGGSGEYFWPVAGGYISAYMGDNRGHKGLDIAAPYGTNVYAAAEGTISRIGNKSDGYGNCIFITHNDGSITVYAHMSSMVDFTYGETVVAGQLIGYVGSTGNSSGNHLHFEVRVNGAYKNPLNYVSQK